MFHLVINIRKSFAYVQPCDQTNFSFAGVTVPCAILLPFSDSLMTIKDVAKVLCVSYGMAYKIVTTIGFRASPAGEKGRCWRCRPEQLKEWMDKQQAAAQTDREE